MVSCYINNNKLVALGTYFFLVEFSEGIWFEIGIHAKQVHAEDDRWADGTNWFCSLPVFASYTSNFPSLVVNAKYDPQGE